MTEKTDFFLQNSAVKFRLNFKNKRFDWKNQTFLLFIYTFVFYKSHKNSQTKNKLFLCRRKSVENAHFFYLSFCIPSNAYTQLTATIKSFNSWSLNNCYERRWILPKLSDTSSGVQNSFRSILFKKKKPTSAFLSCHLTSTVSPDS